MKIRSKVVLINIVSVVVAAVGSLLILQLVTSFMTTEKLDSLSDSNLLILIGVILLSYAILLSIIFIVITSILTNSFISRRIKQLEEQTKEIIKGDYSDHIDINQKDEIGSLARTYKVMLQALRSNEYLNKNFIRNISHEMKTPLTAIYSYATLIGEEEDEDKVKQYSNIIKFESKRLATLSVDLLTVSELDSNQIIPTLDIYSLSEQLREIIILTQPTWEQREISFDLELEEVKIKSNKPLMHIVIMNLISNAIKYTETNQDITVSLKKENNNVLLIISNPGKIKKEDITHIFTMFYTTDKDKSKRSNGVGLTLAKRILNRLSATIRCKSVNNVVTFEVRLRDGFGSATS